MGAKGEVLAEQFEKNVREAVDTLKDLSDADWQKTTAAEKWPVGVTAHHLAGALEPIAKGVQALVAGKPLGFSRDMIDKVNAKHAEDYANCTKAETIELFKKGAAAAAAVIRGLSDEQLAKSGSVDPALPPMSAEEFINKVLISHMDAHFGSIRKTVGK